MTCACGSRCPLVFGQVTSSDHTLTVAHGMPPPSPAKLEPLHPPVNRGGNRGPGPQRQSWDVSVDLQLGFFWGILGEKKKLDPLPTTHTPLLGMWWAQVSTGVPAVRTPDCREAGPDCVPSVSSRVGQRGSGLSMSAARSEHEVSEIIDGLSEQEVSPWP